METGFTWWFQAVGQEQWAETDAQEVSPGNEEEFLYCMGE